MSGQRIEGMKQMDAGTGFWRNLPEIIWRALVFIVAVAILIFVSTRWDYWEGSPGWKTTDDAYLQADVTPIASKVAGYILELPVQDFEQVHGGELLAQIVDVDYRAAIAQGEANVASAIAQSGSSSTEAMEKLNTLRAQLSAQLAQTGARAAAPVRRLGVLAAQRAQSDAAIRAHRATRLTARNVKRFWARFRAD